MNFRLTSLNIFDVGITWEFTEKDRFAAQRLMNFLADRRILRVGRSRPQVERRSACGPLTSAGHGSPSC